MPKGHLILKNPRTGVCLLALVASTYSYVRGQTGDSQASHVSFGTPIVQLESMPPPPSISAPTGVSASRSVSAPTLGMPVASPATSSTSTRLPSSSIISTPPPPASRVMRVAGFEGHETYAAPRTELYPSVQSLSTPGLRSPAALVHSDASASLGTPKPMDEGPQASRPVLTGQTPDSRLTQSEPRVTLDRPVPVVGNHPATRTNSSSPPLFRNPTASPNLGDLYPGNATLQRPIPVQPVGDANETLAELAIPDFGLPEHAPDPRAKLPEARPAARPELSFDDLLSDSLVTPEDGDDLLLGGQSSQQVEELPTPTPRPNSRGKVEAGSGGGSMPSGSPRVPNYSPEDALGLPPVGDAGQDAYLPEASGQVSPSEVASSDKAEQSDTKSEEDSSKEKYDGPYFFEPMGKITGPRVDTLARQVPYQPGTFMPPPIRDVPVDPVTEGSVYRGKFPVTVQRPLIELWRPLYTSGIYPEAKTWFGDRNLVMPHFMVYGDFRTGMGINRNAQGDTNNLAFRANLDMDLEITATERIHAFMGPLDRGGDFTKLEFANSADWVNRTDMRLDTLFFEGDVGSILAGMRGEETSLDLPFSFGFLPFFYQNGIWANDNALGAAFALPARHSRLLNWSNYDATFFWASDQINSDAFPGDNNAAEFFGTAWFIEAYDGYIEADYAFVHDDVIEDRSYHNISFAYTRRYLQRLSNSIRFITNVGQDLPSDQRTADGHLILIENSLISSTPNTFVPYLNFFYGQGRTQSLARAGIAGGILNNTGINFENDGLTGYPTLDATGVNATGAALGLNMLGASFEQQLIVEFAALAANGDTQFRNAPGDQYAVGMRYQRPLSNAWIFRTDHMFGFLRNADDIRGSRVEFRMKF